MNELRQSALACLQLTDPLSKVNATQQLYQDHIAAKLSLATTVVLNVPDQPGRPAKPELVMPKALTRRRNSQQHGHAPLLHAICHIEFNAINLALDALARFAGLPEQFYCDWLRVAHEEAEHFRLLRDHLVALGYDYGRFSAHNSLWEMATRTQHDALIRMALVPRVLEARGLDVTPNMITKLAASGDQTAVAILELILQEEIDHVKIGSHWFNYLCELRDLEPLATFKQLLAEYFTGELRGPFNYQARKLADFTDAEMALLEGN